MYDKSKKTWSQRLKITKTEKAVSSTAASSAITVTAQSSGQIAASSPSHSSPGASQCHTATAAMHLPGLQLSDYHNGHEFLPSALSRSMKYAEPWIYGTVRGNPARPAYHHHQYHPQHHSHHHQQITSANYTHHPHAAAVFATAAHPMPHSEALAIVICSCPEYLSGTKRDVKKASVCKKCRGSRLPLATIGGTVRLPMLASSKLARSNLSGAATMRVVSSTKKSRPTILDPQKDPYDLMRRTRLLSPEISGESIGSSGVGGSTSTGKDKSSVGNPPRGRTRSRFQPQPPPLTSKKTSTASNSSTPTTPNTDNTADPSDSWLIEYTDALIDRNNATAGGQRRSILRCNVNPYDLISIPKSNATPTKSSTSSQFHGSTKSVPIVSKKILNTPNEFRPNRDDDFNVEDAALNDEAPPFTTASSYETSASSSNSITDECLSYNNNVQAIAGKRISLGERKITQNISNRQCDDGRADNRLIAANSNYEPIFDDGGSDQCSKTNAVLPKAQPQRPARTKRQDSAGAEKSQLKLDVASCSSSSTMAKSAHEPETASPLPSPLVVTATPSQNIKSILKRPTTWRNTSPGGEFSDDATTSSPTSPSLRRQDSTSNSETISASSTEREATNSLMPLTCNSGYSSGSTTPTVPQSQSQFYIPMPKQQQPRKKVQFLVEEKVILVDEPQNYDNQSELQQTQEHLVHEVGVNAENDTHEDQAEQQRPNYEYYNRKREVQQKLLAEEQSELELVTPESQPFTTNDNADSTEDKLQYEDVLPMAIVSTKPEQGIINDDAENASIQQGQLPKGGDYDDVAKMSPNNLKNKTTTIIILDEGTWDTDKDHEKSFVPTKSASDKKEDLKALGPNDTANRSRTANNSLQQTQQQQHQVVTQSRHPIRRSHSERHHYPHENKHFQIGIKPTSEGSEKRQSEPLGGNSGDSLKFKDTMALRMKNNNRFDSRKLFAAMGSPLLKDTLTAGMSRPKEPPPPPPPSSPLPPLPPLPPPELKESNGTEKQASRDLVESVDTKQSHAFKPNHDSSSTAYSQIQELTPEALNEDNVPGEFHNQNSVPTENFLDENNQQSNPQEEPTNEAICQRSVQNNNNTKCKESEINTTTDNNDSLEVSMEQKNRKDVTILRKHQQQQQQRTVVRVAPFNKVVSTEVHRLKINHTDETPSPQRHSSSPFHMKNGFNSSVPYLTDAKKTSILISGDDCYSTMNLSCDASTPIYQSSVVVTDCASPNISGDFSNRAYPSASTPKTPSQLLTPIENHRSFEGLKMTTTSNTVTINVSSPRNIEEDIMYEHNKLNSLLSQQARTAMNSTKSSERAIIPICCGTVSEVNLQRSASSTSSTSTSSMTSISSSASAGGNGGVSTPKRSRTLIKVDYEEVKATQPLQIPLEAHQENLPVNVNSSMVSHEEELLKILRNPVEAVKRNLVPHICGRQEIPKTDKDNIRNKKMKETNILGVTSATADTNEDLSATPIDPNILLTPSSTKTGDRNSFIAKLLEDPMLSHLADGLETDTVAELIENSLKRLKRSRNAIDISGTKDNDNMNRLINVSLLKVREERQAAAGSNLAAVIQPQSPQSMNSSNNHLTVPTKDEDRHSNRGSISSANSFASANNFEFEFDANESDCYQSCSSEITSPDDDASSAATRFKFYQMLVDATLAEIEMSTTLDDDHITDGIEDTDDHHYESIRLNSDPIYEEINEVPPPLPLTAPPQNDTDLEKKVARSIFEGASKYDILSYLVDAKERGVVREENFDYPFNCSNPIIIEEEACDTLSELGKRINPKKDSSSRSTVNADSREDNLSAMSSLSPSLPPHGAFTFGCSSNSLLQRKSASSDIERNDSGVGSETSKSSRSKYQQLPNLSNNNGNSQPQLSKNTPIHLCEDCDGPVETQITESGVLYAPLVCRKCGKKRIERKEIVTEIVETEEKYGRDLQIILEEFCHPMLVAGLLTQEQLSAIFLNTEELLENNQTLAERMRDALDIAIEQGDDDLLTVNIGRIFLDFTQMLHAFESYCVRQAGASLLLANLEKEKELLRIFLKVSQMENAVLRRMNLNSFLMVPVQRVTKYPLLLARLYKVTPPHLEGREQLKQAQEKIELHLNHINQEAKDVPTKLWRRISSSSPNRRASCEIDMINIKLRKMAIDILEWNHDEVRFAMEGKLLYTQPTDSNWKKARTIKLTPINALLVTNGKPNANYKAEKVMTDKLNFPNHHTGIREASLLVVKEKCGRYTLIREPFYLDKCIVCSEADWDDYFEIQEISSKDTFIFKAEDGVRTKQWYTQLQYHAQGMGAWRKRRNALANIMINGMMARN